MALLPIYIEDIITPYNIGASESTDLVINANNKSQMVRRAGYFYTVVMGIKPRNMIAFPQRFWEIVGHITAYPTFEIPIHNMQASQLTSETLTVTDNNLVGDSVLTVTNTTAKLNPGQYIKFSNKPKLYQVLSHVGTTLTLMQPLSAAVNAADNAAVIYKQPGYKGQVFNGITATFLNEDFGNPIYKIEDGLLGEIGPLVLREFL